VESVRTPDARFARLAAFPHAPRSLEVGEGRGPTARMAYVATGAHENRPVVLLHGGATWGYLWRGVIPTLIDAGCRVVAPDLVGFGKSDKPTRMRDVSRARQLGWLRDLCGKVDVAGAVLVFHGTSGLLGLELLAALPGRFSAAVAVSPILGAGDELDAYRERLREAGVAAADLVATACVAPPTEAARAAYDAPFPEREHAAALRALPGYLPDADGWATELAAAPGVADLPLLAVTGELDRVAGAEPAWLDALPSSARRERATIAGAGHHVPEDRGPELALAILGFMVTPAASPR
jgi:haloalkane dehalogenase